MAKSRRQINYTMSWYALAIARIMVGFVFIWAFIDKTFGFGISTPQGKAWLDGASPTAGFLLKGVNPESPLVDFFHSLAHNPSVDWLFMLGLFGIGAALIVGIGLRVAAVTGTILLSLMWLAELPLETNPIVDDHLVYAAVLWAAALGVRKLSLFDAWTRVRYVKKNEWLW